MPEYHTLIKKIPTPTTETLAHHLINDCHQDPNQVAFLITAQLEAKKITHIIITNPEPPADPNQEPVQFQQYHYDNGYYDKDGSTKPAELTHQDKTYTAHYTFPFTNTPTPNPSLLRTTQQNYQTAHLVTELTDITYPKG